MSTFNVKVQYDMMPIRHIAVECPKCKKWFVGWHITNDHLYWHNEIYMVNFICPLCGEKFGRDFSRSNEWEPNIEECGCFEDVYKDCLTREETLDYLTNHQNKI